jgi:hypothetical protein
MSATIEPTGPVVVHAVGCGPAVRPADRSDGVSGVMSPAHPLGLNGVLVPKVKIIDRFKILRFGINGRRCRPVVGK